MKGHLERLLRLSDHKALEFMKRVDLDKDSRDYGGYFDNNKGFVETSSDAAFHGALSFYYNEKSRHFRYEPILDYAIAQVNHLIKDMNADGTLDLRETNFHDATVCGFTIRTLGYTYKLVEKFSAHTAKEDELQAAILDAITRMAEGMRTGGFHTPNHRWVLSSALSLAYSATKDARLLAEIDKYLSEGIDLNEDGDYNEQSISMYDIITNESFIIIAEELGRPELLEPVRHNLNKLACYIEPDGTVNNLNSHRQDHGTKAYPTGHYWSCVYMAHKFNDPLYAALAEQLLFQMEELRTGADIARYMLYPQLNEEIKLGQVPTEYELYLPKSGIMRYRKADSTVTLLENNPVFLKYQVGGNNVLLRLCGSFFAKGQFRAESIQKTEKGYRMRYFQRWGYKKVLEEKPDTSDWNLMPHEKRPQVHMQDYEINIDVILDGETVHVDIDADCRHSNVPCKVEMLLQPGGYLESASSITHGLAGASTILSGESGVYVKDAEGLRIDGGEAFHYYTRTMRGSLPVVGELFTVYTTFFTPHKHRISFSPASGVAKLPAFK